MSSWRDKAAAMTSKVRAWDQAKALMMGETGAEAALRSFEGVPAAVVIPPPRRDLVDALIADLVDGLMPLRTVYGLPISDEAMRDRASNIAQGLIANYRVGFLPDALPAPRAPYRGRR